MGGGALLVCEISYLFIFFMYCFAGVVCVLFVCCLLFLVCLVFGFWLFMRGGGGGLKWMVMAD